MLDAVTLDQLRAFATIADEGSFSAAARKLRRVQSAVSHAIGIVEDQLGVQLFDRSARLPRLTAQGRKQLRAKTSYWTEYAAAVFRILGTA